MMKQVEGKLAATRDTNFLKSSKAPAENKNNNIKKTSNKIISRNSFLRKEIKIVYSMAVNVVLYCFYVTEYEFHFLLAYRYLFLTN